MGNRLSRIYTRTGDDGTTGLGDGSRIGKDSLRVQAMGSVDELNAAIGVLLTEELPEAISQQLVRIQHDLFNLGGEICIPGHSMLDKTRVDALENFLDTLNEHLSPLKEFILPGGSRAGAYCHLARTICRRAERDAIALARQEEVTPHALKYLNRLSDVLFVTARSINQYTHHPDILWQK